MHLFKVLLCQTFWSKVQTKQKLVLQLRGSSNYFKKNKKKDTPSTSTPHTPPNQLDTQVESHSHAVLHISTKGIRIQAAWADIPLLLKMCHSAERIQDLFSQKELTRVWFSSPMNRALICEVRDHSPARRTASVFYPMTT